MFVNFIWGGVHQGKCQGRKFLNKVLKSLAGNEMVEGTVYTVASRYCGIPLPRKEGEREVILRSLDLL